MENRLLGAALAKDLCELFLTTKWDVDLVVPVPISRFREETRGFNQTELISDPFSKKIGLRYLPTLLTRIRDTALQTNFRKYDRIKNQQGTFLLVATVKDLRVLVIDDVFVTGATLDAAAIVLKKGGAKSVYGLSLAKSLLHSR